MAKKRESSNKNLSKDDEKRLFAFLATFLSIIGFFIALVAKRKDKYVMYYARISLVIFVIIVIAGVISRVFLIIPIIGDIINVALSVLSVILWITSWVFSFSGKEKYIPIITEWANKIDL